MTPLAMSCGGGGYLVNFSVSPGQRLIYDSEISMTMPANLDPAFNTWSEDERTIRINMSSYASLQSKAASSAVWKIGIDKATMSGKLASEMGTNMSAALNGRSATVTYNGATIESITLTGAPGPDDDVTKGFLMMLAAPAQPSVPKHRVSIGDTFDEMQTIDGTNVSGKGKVEAAEKIGGDETLRISMTLVAPEVTQSKPAVVWLRVRDGVLVRLKAELSYTQDGVTIPMSVAMTLRKS